MFTPTIVKILTYLRESRERKTGAELAVIINEQQDYVNQALCRLVSHGIVSEKAGFYVYESTPDGEEISNKLLEVYEVAGGKPAQELLIRGLIWGMFASGCDLDICSGRPATL